MKIIECKCNGEIYTINEKDRTMEIKLADKTNVLSFEKLNEIIIDTKNVNRIYKPFSLLFYIDYKNNKLKNWKNILIKEITI